MHAVFAGRDEQVKHNGHATLRMASGEPPEGTWCEYVSHNRHAAALAGKTVKLSAWIKAVDVAGEAVYKRSGSRFRSNNIGDDGLDEIRSDGADGWWTRSRVFGCGGEAHWDGEGVGGRGEG